MVASITAVSSAWLANVCGVPGGAVTSMPGLASIVSPPLVNVGAPDRT